MTDEATNMGTSKSERNIRQLLIETAMRTKISFPLNAEQKQWFEEGLNGDFMERLYNEIDTEANVDEEAGRAMSDLMRLVRHTYL